MINRYGDISPRVGVRLAARLLKVGRPRMLTQRFMQTESQERNSGQVRIFRRYHSFPVTTAPLAEGISPEGMPLRYTDYPVTMQQYGGSTELTDVVRDTHEDPILQKQTELLGDWAADVTETIAVDLLCSGTNVYYPGSVTSRTAVNAPISLSLVRKVTRGFARARASMISRVISPSAKVSTQGVEAGYFAMCHTDLDSDIRNCQGFTAVVNYGNPDQSMDEEVGAVEKVRFLTSDLWKPWYAAASGVSSTSYLSNGSEPSSAAAPDVYPVVVVAKDAYACVRLQGRSAVEITVVQPKPTNGDILGQRGGVGCKWWFGAVITNDMWIARMEVACTANP